MKDGVPAFGFFLLDDSDRVVDNEQVLNSFVRYGIWLRYSLAYDQVNTLRSRSDAFLRIAATANFYSAVGALVEDVAASLLAWICWERRPDLLLADVLNLTTFHKDKKAKASSEYLETAIEKLIAGKRTQVDIVCLASSLQLLGGITTLKMIGLPWKRIPSVKLAKEPRELEFWQKLPEGIANNVLQRLSDKGLFQLSLAYNKIKHGPQLVVTNLIDHWGERGPNTAAIKDLHAKLEGRGLKPETLQILFDGAHTACSGNKIDPSSLFLDDDSEAIEAAFAGIVHPLAKTMWLIGMWLRKRKFGHKWENPPPHIIESEEVVERTLAVIRARRLLG